jgi:hypothetical protein
MKTLLVTTLALWSAGAMAVTDSDKTLFEISSAHLTKIATSDKEEETSAIESVLSILEGDRPAIKANGVNTQGRDLKADAAASAKTL